MAHDPEGIEAMLRRFRWYRRRRGGAWYRVGRGHGTEEEPLDPLTELSFRLADRYGYYPVWRTYPPKRGEVLLDREDWERRSD